MLSMTAFARRDASTPWGQLVWELRSVNHRYLEIAPRLPEELRGLEPQVRQFLVEKLARGKVDCILRFQSKETAAAPLELDSAVIERLAEAAERVRDIASGASPLRAIDVLRWPGALKAVELDVDALGHTALELLGATVDELVATRAREGERLAELISQRLDAASEIVTALASVTAEMREQLRSRLRDRLAELKQEVEPMRFEQEIALLAQKADVQEELDRLQAHLVEVRSVLGTTGPIGRRMDFLMQELNREANTLSAKSSDLRATNSAIDLKVLIEQMREQVQNIE